MNETTDVPPYTSDIPEVERYIEGTLLTLIASVAILGNASVWLVVLSTKALRTDSNFLLLSLSLADLLVSVVSMPLTAVTIFMSRWIFSSVTCKAVGFINMLTLVASVMSLGLISINRYIKICHPNFYKGSYSARNILLMTAGVWTLSAILASPPLVGWGVYDYLPRQSFCFCLWTTSKSYTFFMVGACFFGPLTMMSACYFKIIRTFRQSSRRIRTQQPPSYNQSPNVEGTNQEGGQVKTKWTSKTGLGKKMFGGDDCADADTKKRRVRVSDQMSNNHQTRQADRLPGKNHVKQTVVKIIVCPEDEGARDVDTFSELGNSSLDSKKSLNGQLSISNDKMAQTQRSDDGLTIISSSDAEPKTLTVPQPLPISSPRSSTSSLAELSSNLASELTSTLDVKAIMKDGSKVEGGFLRRSKDSSAHARSQRKTREAISRGVPADHVTDDRYFRVCDLLASLLHHQCSCQCLLQKLLDVQRTCSH
ncbi:hypothetical protein C0Q70_02453 [Pomacea canaliculata]|uniref:G-protein coupled receptors family 1 profile domain-containing protein n=1 Tax=Pomacea canaliculata TaxID=400727 RepID=A0A2T7PQ13_POMCA|nr:hypothetical protein C0Q70_02453 [Pomacea canaliculata]